MKSIFTVLLFYCFSLLQVSAQNKTPQLSAAAKQYLFLSKKSNTNILDQYVYQTDAQHTIYINTIFMISPNFNEAALKPQGVKIGTKAKDIYTAKVPVSSINQFIKTQGIQYIDFDQPCYPELDTARRLTRVDSVHQGIYLPQAYSGKNVVVGIVDAGFDYTHPTFFDTTLMHFRIKRAWEQKNVSGTAPSAFGYGTEYIDSASIWNKHYDITSGTHGTHVMGIAGGSGGGNSALNKRFRGMAYESELVTVAIYPTAAYWLNTGMVDMLDGINYVFNYAASVSKPAVANLSWGCPLGPRDGTSLFSQACNNLVDAGKIFVLSGGNNGDNNIHLKKTFTPNDTVVNTICTFPSSLVDKKNQLDVWGELGKSFCMEFSLYNLNTKVDSTYTICLDDSTHQFNLVGSNGDTCFVTITTVAAEFNGKPHMLVQLYSRVGDRLCVTIKGNTGTVNMWQGIVVSTSGYYGVFTKNGYTWAVNGDSQMTCGDLVSTERALAVAAYNSKPSFTNISGQNLGYQGYAKGAIAAFSSKGPTTDGRTKPNIAGPGLALASSISALDSTYFVGGDDYSSVVANFVSPLNGDTYAYAMAAGTSMSSPAVAGIVALLLEKDPTLTPEQVMTLLAETAITDSKTGIIPLAGSNTWGFGKVNAYRAMAKLNGVLSTHTIGNTIDVLVYPNPTDGLFSVDFYAEQNETLQFTISDIAGRVVSTQTSNSSPGDNHITIDLSAFSNGIYVLHVKSAKGNSNIKLIKH